MMMKIAKIASVSLILGLALSIPALAGDDHSIVDGKCVKEVNLLLQKWQIGTVDHNSGTRIDGKSKAREFTGKDQMVLVRPSSNGDLQIDHYSPWKRSAHLGQTDMRVQLNPRTCQLVSFSIPTGWSTLKQLEVSAAQCSKIQNFKGAAEELNDQVRKIVPELAEDTADLTARVSANCRGKNAVMAKLTTPNTPSPRVSHGHQNRDEESPGARRAL